MSTMTDIWGGVDTHADTHTAVVIDAVGRLIDTEVFEATAAGYARLIEWMGSSGQLQAVGVEGTGSYGAGLARALLTAGVDVREVNRANRQHRRRHGKSDPADALAAAKAVLSGDASGRPRCVDGPVEAVRNLSVTRAGLVKTRTKVANQVHALIVTAPDHLRQQLKDNTLPRIVKNVAAFDTPDTASVSDPAAAVIACLKTLTGLWADLGARINDLERALEVATAAAAPPILFDEVGVATVTASPLIVVAGTDPHRFETDSAFAAACGVSAVDASSGKQSRHRLNRGGDRQANAALYRIVIVRLRYHQPTKDYMARRLAEGKTKREIIRMLKRYVARDIYKILTQPT